MKGLSDQFKGHVANGVSFPKSTLPGWHWCEVIICSIGNLKCSSGWICTHTYIYTNMFTYIHILHFIYMYLTHMYIFSYIYIIHITSVAFITSCRKTWTTFLANPIFPRNYYSDDTPSIVWNIPSQCILHPYKSNYCLPASSKHYISYLKGIKVSNYGKVP